MKNLLTIVMFMILVSGCSSQSACVYPTFPKPSQSVLNSIRDTNSTEVNAWMTELFKLNEKLK